MFREFTVPKGIKVLEETEKYGKYEFMPLQKGYGVTVGNALRRVLLSSIPGSSVIGVKIDNVLHEFSSIDGVLEDVPYIVLNLKKVRFKYHGVEPYVEARIFKEGKGVVTAADIKTPPELEVVNKDQVIATLTSDSAKFVALLTVAKGYGYVPAEEFPEDFKKVFPEGTIFIDGLFSPITKVNYTVENVRVRERTDFERLVIEIWTDGSILPGDALRKAADILIDTLHGIKRIVTKSMEREAPSFQEKEWVRSLLIKQIDTSVLTLSVGTVNLLKEANIKTIGDLVTKSESELKKIAQIGDAEIEEIKRELKAKGLSLGMDIKKFIEEMPKDEA